MATDDTQSLLNAGIQAAKAGNKIEARRFFEQVLEKDDNNEQAWMWFASVVDTPRERRICLENVLEINPNNTRARQALDKLIASTPATARSADASSLRSELLDKEPSAPASSSLPRFTEGPTTMGDTVVRSGRRPQQEAPVRRRRRISPALFITGVIAALVLIGGGLLLLLGGTGAPPPAVEGPTAPGSTPGAVAAAPSPGGATLTPVPTIDPALLRGTITLVPTWTASPTNTPLPTLTPTATLPPLGGYTLTFIGEGRGRKAPGLYTVNADGSNEKLLINDDNPVMEAAWFGDQKIAYTTVIDNKGQLFVANADGSSPTKVAESTTQSLHHPAWSPDGAKLAFVTDETGNSEIYLINVDGSGRTQLTNNTVEDRDPSFAPDGSKIVYASDPTGKKSLQIFMLDLKTNKATQLTSSTNDNYSPVYSPDGTQIAFISSRDRFPRVYLMDADGKNQKLPPFLPASESTSRDPSWSSDGQYIAFASDRDGKVFNLFIMTPDGKNMRQITKSKDPSYGAAFRLGQPAI
ncbi:MAG: PD40 domain-containing protein [Anaerolineae bacterium]|nr:PD40 domain-containing protein [Anaerolineae bacterium]